MLEFEFVVILKKTYTIRGKKIINIIVLDLNEFIVGSDIFFVKGIESL